MSTAELSASISALLAGGLLWALFCRINLLRKGVSLTRVWFKHTALAVAAGTSMLVSPQWDYPVLLAGVTAFVLLDAWRWRGRAPLDTYINPEAAAHAAGQHPPAPPAATAGQAHTPERT